MALCVAKGKKEEIWNVDNTCLADLNNIYKMLGFSESSVDKESTSNVGDLGSIPGSGRFLEKGKATYSTILAWRIPRARKESDSTE